MAPMLNPHFKNTLFFGSVSPSGEMGQNGVPGQLLLRFAPFLLQ